MQPFMASYNSQGYALMRMIVGFLFLWHGVQKLFNFPPGMPAGVPAYIIYGAGSIELICGILVMIGLFTRYAAFLARGQMAAAYWMANGTKALLPLKNQGELAVISCFVFLFISSQGGGIWCVVAAQQRR
jgi:putative oxidoreductase